jgi:hypothetical protein
MHTNGTVVKVNCYLFYARARLLVLPSLQTTIDAKHLSLVVPEIHLSTKVTNNYNYADFQLSSHSNVTVQSHSLSPPNLKPPRTLSSWIQDNTQDGTRLESSSQTLYIVHRVGGF